MSAQRGLFVLLNRVVRGGLPEKGAFGVLKEVRGDHVVIWGKSIPSCERTLAMEEVGYKLEMCVSPLHQNVLGKYRL